jgi:hypothetical protein
VSDVAVKQPEQSIPDRFPKWFEASRWQLAMVAALCLALTVLLQFRSQPLLPGMEAWDLPHDHHKYFYMATHPLGSFHIQPPAWRIGVPWLVSILPVSTINGFRIISFLSVWSIGVLLFVWLRLIPVSSMQALLGVILLYSYGAVSKFSMNFYMQPDPVSYIFVLLGLIFIYKRMDWAFALTLVLGITVKETVALVGPLFYTLRARRWIDGPLLVRTILVGLPAFAVLVGIRIMIPAWNKDLAYVGSLPAIYTEVHEGKADWDPISGFIANVNVYAHMSPINVLRLFTFGSMGLLMFLPFLDLRRNKELLLRWLPYVGMVAASLLVALNADRRIGACFPFLILAGIYGLEEFSKSTRIPVEWWQVAFLLQYALLLVKRDVVNNPFDLVAAVFLVTLIVMYHRVRSRPITAR